MQKLNSILLKIKRVKHTLNLKSHPELALFSSVEEGQMAMRRAARRLLKQPAYYLTVFVAVGFSLGSTLLLRSAVASWGLPISELAQNLILAIPVIAACCVFGIWVLKKYLALNLRNELLQCGVPVCISCGYPLIRLSGSHCPECGKQFDDNVREILKKE